MARAGDLSAVFHGGHLRRLHDVLFFQPADTKSRRGWAMVKSGSELRVVARALSGWRLAGTFAGHAIERDKGTLK